MRHLLSFIEDEVVITRSRPQYLQISYSLLWHRLLILTGDIFLKLILSWFAIQLFLCLAKKCRYFIDIDFRGQFKISFRSFVFHRFLGDLPSNSR